MDTNLEFRPLFESFSEDKVYNTFMLRFNKYINLDEEELFSRLINDIVDYSKYEGTVSLLIEYDLKGMKDISFLDKEITDVKSDFSEDERENKMLTYLFPRIVKLYQNFYKYTYYLSGDILVSGKNVDLKKFLAYKDFVLNNHFNNFYADIVFYHEDERFYNECMMLDAVNASLEGNNTNIDLDKLKNKLDKMQIELIDKIIPKGKVLEKRK